MTAVKIEVVEVQAEHFGNAQRLQAQLDDRPISHAAVVTGDGMSQRTHFIGGQPFGRALGQPGRRNRLRGINLEPSRTTKILIELTDCHEPAGTRRRRQIGPCHLVSEASDVLVGNSEEIAALQPLGELTEVNQIARYSPPAPVLGGKLGGPFLQ